MLLNIHIFFAITSLFLSLYCLVKPSRGKFYASIFLTLTTIVLGSILLISSQYSHMLTACLFYSVYIIGISIVTVITDNKIIAIHQD